MPLLSAANWGGHGLHARGNFEGFYRSATKDKWLEAHGIEHWTHCYTDYGRELQQQFFDHFLKGEDNGWENRRRVQLQIRHPQEVFVERHEDDWPIPRTRWTEFYLHPDLSLREQPPIANTTLEFDTMGDGLRFRSAPLTKPIELTGPSAAKLWVSSTTEDTDLFLILQVFDPEGREVTFQGALDPHTPIGHGWLRASHRKLDSDLSERWRPHHTHDERKPLTPAEIYQTDVETWPTSIVVPAEYTVGLWIRGRD